MLSTLKLDGFLGRTARTASATKMERKSSLPDCLEAMTVRIALASSVGERRSFTESTTSSGDVLACVYIMYRENTSPRGIRTI